MTDAREVLVALIRRAMLSNAAHARPVESVVADAILAEFDVTLRGERVKPSVEDVARLIGKRWNMSPRNKDVLDDARTILALLPGRTEAEAKAEALRDAASAAVTVEEGIPWDHDHDRATVSAWLEGRADRIEKGEGRG